MKTSIIIEEYSEGDRVRIEWQDWSGLYNEVVGEIVSMTEESVVVERGDGEWEIVFYDRILTMNKI